VARDAKGERITRGKFGIVQRGECTLRRWVSTGCCCALSAHLLENAPETPAGYSYVEMDAVSIAAARRPAWAYGFTTGFDGSDLPPENANADGKAGHAAGTEVLRRLLELGIPVHTVAGEVISAASVTT
jgi:hypothetical protein